MKSIHETFVKIEVKKPKPTINANNFEIKLSFIQMVQQSQFGGNAMEDPNIHLANFMALCGTIKINGISDETIKLRLFPF